MAPCRHRGPRRVLPSLAQSPRAVRLRATIDAANAKSLDLTTTSGQQLTLALASDTVILAVVPMKLEDIKPGAYIGAAAMPQPDGTQRALEVHVFPRPCAAPPRVTGRTT